MSIFSVITVTCLILCTWYQITDGLVCYSCIDCNDPFNRNYVGVSYQNDSSNYFCSKTSVGYVISRSITIGCVSSGTVGNGRWCCQTDLCNEAKRKNLTNTFRFAIGILMFTVLLFK